MKSADRVIVMGSSNPSALSCATPFEVAWKLLILGFSVVPSGGGETGKAPIVAWTEYQERQATEGEVQSWQDTQAPRLWGIVTGSISGVVVFDCDTAQARGLFDGLRPHVVTPRGGAHFYFKHPGHHVKTVAGLLAGLDVRGDGGFVNVAGSRSDGDYRVEIVPTRDTLYALAQLPPQVQAALAEADKPPTIAPSTLIREGDRNSRLTTLAGSMRRQGAEREAIEAALLEANRSQCQPPLSESEVRAIVKSILRYEPQTPSSTWPESLADEALHGLAGEVVRLIRPHTEADDPALLVNFLLAFGNSVGRGPHAVAEADRHGTNLSAVLVGESAKGRKGSSWGHIRELLARADPTWAGEHVAEGLSSGEGLIWCVRDPIERVVPTKDKGRSTGDFETLVEDAGVSDKRLFVLEGEFSRVLRVMARDGNTLSPVLRGAWDTGSLRTLTKNSPAKSTGAHISVMGHITKEELLRYLNDVEMANGFANRFLWVCTGRARVLPEGGGQVPYGRIVGPLKKALEYGRQVGELRRGEAARQLWAQVYPELSEGKPGLLGAITARAEAQVLRLSLLYALLDSAQEIDTRHLAAALALWDYCQGSARYIFGDALGNPICDRILEGLQAKPEGLSRTDISQLFARHVSQARLDRALQLLRNTGRAHSETVVTEGRSAEMWVLSHNSLISHDGG